MSGVAVKRGDLVGIGPFVVEHLYDTDRPGPRDSGDTAILSRHESVGALSADTSLLIPWSPALPAVARWLADGDEHLPALRTIRALCRRDPSWHDNDALVYLDGLIAALEGEG